jgi:hypothetical protein
MNRVLPALRLGISTRAATRIGLTGASTRRRPARPCFAGFTAGDFNPHRSYGRLHAETPCPTVFRRLYGWGFQPAWSVFFGNTIVFLAHCGPCFSVT